jgi:Lysozyme like domain
MATTSATSPSVANTVSSPSLDSGTGSGVYNYQQLQQLWVQAGGNPAAAALMAAIALSESGGNPRALNNNPATGDYSVGLWQINYFGNLAPSRTARYGTPSQLQANPLLNAQAAVDLYAGGKGLGNWSGDAAYAAYASGGMSGIAQYVLSRGQNPALASNLPKPSFGQIASTPGATGSPEGGIPFGGQIQSAVSTVESTGKFLGELSNPNFWIRALEIIGGMALIGLGLYLIAKDMGASLPSPGSLPMVGGVAKGADEAAASMTSVERPAKMRQVELPVDREYRESRKGRRPKRGEPGSSKLARGDEIPF